MAFLNKLVRAFIFTPRDAELSWKQNPGEAVQFGVFQAYMEARYGPPIDKGETEDINMSYAVQEEIFESYRSETVREKTATQEQVSMV